MCSPLIPQPARIAHIRHETPDIKTFRVAGENGLPFDFQPGQCAMLGVPGVGEAMFSIASSPANADCHEFSIKAVGKLTHYLHALKPGAPLTIRGPYGTPFPVADVLKNRDLLFVAGGIGIAPLRSVVRYVLDKRGEYGEADIVYGARSAADIVYAHEIEHEWATAARVYLTIDRPEEQWGGHVGFVPSYIKELDFSADNKTALVCGPPVMIKYSLEALAALGFEKKHIYTTLEMRMKCGVGTCGRCNIGAKYICKDGPVFRCDVLDDLPEAF